MKRFFDIFVSFIGLLLLLWLFAIVAVWIKLDSKGPVFYRQSRVGKGGRDFCIFKFRTMRTDADKGSLITVGGSDSRITRAGLFLRRTKIDELPQLINVLLGDMSLVGPRPEVRRYVDLYTPEQLHVLDVRPGITDPATIKYRNENELLGAVDDPLRYYVDVIMQDKLAISLDYVQNASLIGDLKVIWETVR